MSPAVMATRSTVAACAVRGARAPNANATPMARARHLLTSFRIAPYLIGSLLARPRVYAVALVLARLMPSSIGVHGIAQGARTLGADFTNQISALDAREEGTVRRARGYLHLSGGRRGRGCGRCVWIFGGMERSERSPTNAGCTKIPRAAALRALANPIEFWRLSRDALAFARQGGAPVNPPSDFERATMSTQDGLERELDMLLAKAGASVPPHLKAGILSGYQDMKVMAATLRQPRTAAAEPPNIFSLKMFDASADPKSTRLNSSHHITP